MAIYLGEASPAQLGEMLDPWSRCVSVTLERQDRVTPVRLQWGRTGRSFGIVWVVDEMVDGMMAVGPDLGEPESARYSRTTLICRVCAMTKKSWGSASRAAYPESQGAAIGRQTTLVLQQRHKPNVMSSITTPKAQAGLAPSS